MATNPNDIRHIGRQKGIPDKIYRVVNGELTADKDVKKIIRIMNGSPVVVWDIGEPEPPEPPASHITILDMLAAKYYQWVSVIIYALESDLGIAHTGTITFDSDEPRAYNSLQTYTKQSAAVGNPHHIVIDCPLTEIKPKWNSSGADYTYSFGRQIFTYIKFADTIRKIGNYAFNNCSFRNCEIDFSNVEYVAHYAFYNSLGSSSYGMIINAPNVRSFDGGVFYNDGSSNAVVSANIKNCEDVGRSAFRAQRSLSSVTMEKVRWIGMYAFSVCTSLTELEIPETIESIEENAFLGCNAIIRIHKPYNGIEGAPWGANPDNIQWLG